MKTKKLLIAGIDPGTTIAYALLDLKGNILKIKSSKKLTMDSLISEIIKYGRVVVVGSDVNPAPWKMKKVATSLGAKLMVPEKDMSIKEKYRLTKEHDVNNKHELDALASAISAHKRIKALLRKVDVLLEKKNKKELADKIKELLLVRKDLNIDRAIRFLES